MFPYFREFMGVTGDKQRQGYPGALPDVSRQLKFFLISGHQVQVLPQRLDHDCPTQYLQRRAC
jgi:hypothetical protein